jgi:hypothetical protein
MYRWAASVTALTYMFVLIDRALHRRGFLKPYYGVHVIHNAGIVALTAYDVWLSMTQFHSGDTASCKLVFCLSLLCTPFVSYDFVLA